MNKPVTVAVLCGVVLLSISLISFTPLYTYNAQIIREGSSNMSLSMLDEFHDVQTYVKKRGCSDSLHGRILVTVHKGWICGQTRLGNKMFMIAATYIAALRSQACFIMLDNVGNCQWVGWLQSIFPALRYIPTVNSSQTEKWQIFGESSFTKYQKIEVTKNSTVGGYRQSWKYFSTFNEREQLLKLFILNKTLILDAEKRREVILGNFNISSPITVGVHVRIGDMLTDRNIKLGYRVAPHEYYMRAFQKVTEIVGPRNSKNLVFIVATDTRKQAGELIGNLTESYNVAWSDHSAYIDFAILTQCQHSIISGGTYSFWSAFLTGGNVFYYKESVKPGSELSKGYSMESFNLPQWYPL